MNRFIRKEFIWYVMVGGFNTAITYLLYLGCLIFFSYTISYSISYIIGIFTAFILNSKLVFRTKLSWRKAFQFPLVYIVQYIISTFLLYVGISMLNINEKIAPLGVLLLTVPLTFILAKWIFKNKNN
ncbi:GtrA family protein [Paenibacillus contaminans]|uniref:GtrA family protein n=1 Tax=Paenibacillus contaminans TaxID=450362 RepID=A0A329M599_9BACL|nr:GtrA family protein [Paenibacillus contaminans]